MFQKKVEDFVCERCGCKNTGRGYTNHCASCLWSKHVDETPGGRESPCHGMMEPVSIEEKAGKFLITHNCRTCGKTMKNKAAENDSMEAIMELSQK